MNIDTSFQAPIMEQEKTESEQGFDKVSEMLRAGIKAAQAGSRSEARHLLLSVTEADTDNENAWLWLASISEYPEELLVFLRNVLCINPYNERALEWSKATKSLLAKTFVGRGIDAHKQGQHEEARKMLDDILQNSPDLEDAWILKSYLTNSFDEKLLCFEKVLEINPANETAQGSVNSLRLMKSAVEAKEAEENEVSENVKEAVFVEEDQVEDNIPQPESAFEEQAEQEYSAEMIEETHFQAEKSEVESVYENEPLELAAENPVSDYAESYEEEIFATEESENEDFYSQANFEEEISEVDEVIEEETAEVIEFAEETESDSAQVIEPFEEISAAESEYEESAAPVEDYREDYEPQEIVEEIIEETVGNQPEIAEDEEFFAEEIVEEDNFENETGETEEVVIDENIAAHSNGNGNGTAHLSEVEPAACPFCRTENEIQAFVCNGCSAVLTLSDLEMLLAHKEADAEMLRRAVEQMEVEEVRRGFDSDELTFLGIGCINLKNLPDGLKYLRKAAKLDSNNVLLESQVNSLAIRLAEIEEQESIHRSMPQDRTILVVDDSATVRKLICTKLEKSGHNVISAVDGVDALEKLKEVTPDLVLLDITMPRMDGYQVCKLIRNNPEMKDIPVVMISGKDGFFDKVRGRMAGTTGYITKPFGPETLMKTVEAFVSQGVEEVSC